MTGGDWILCERSRRWASALRLALSRGDSRFPPRRFNESRTLAQALLQLAAWPQSLVLIEVNSANLADVLDWLAATTPQFSAARFAALLDSEFFAAPAAGSAAGASGGGEVRDILAEAGMSAAAISPRRLRDVLALAEKHALRVAQPATPLADQSFEAWAWSLLPWQDA